MKSYKGWKVGDFVSPKETVEAYYSGYGGRPKQALQTWQVGRVSAIAPKVRMNRYDREPYMLIVDFIGHRDEMVWKVSITLKNAIKQTEPDRYIVVKTLKESGDLT